MRSVEMTSTCDLIVNCFIDGVEDLRQELARIRQLSEPKESLAELIEKAKKAWEKAKEDHAN